MQHFKVEACVPGRGDGWCDYPDRKSFIAATGHPLPALVCWLALRVNPGQCVSFQYKQYALILDPKA